MLKIFLVHTIFSDTRHCPQESGHYTKPVFLDDHYTKSLLNQGRRVPFVISLMYEIMTFIHEHINWRSTGSSDCCKSILGALANREDAAVKSHLAIRSSVNCIIYLYPIEVRKQNELDFSFNWISSLFSHKLAMLLLLYYGMHAVQLSMTMCLFALWICMFAFIIRVCVNPYFRFAKGLTYNLYKAMCLVPILSRIASIF